MMIEFFIKGGPLMWPILVCSLVSLTIVLDRLAVFYRLRIKVPNLPARVKNLLKENKVEEAVRLCETYRDPVARILAVGIHLRHRAPEEREKLFSRAGTKLVRTLDKNLRVLAVIANAATLLGLLGTVTGMIAAFMKIQTMSGGMDVTALAGGIWEALITTAAGLFVAIPTMVAYHCFEGVVDDMSHAMKDAAAEFLEG